MNKNTHHIIIHVIISLIILALYLGLNLWPLKFYIPALIPILCSIYLIYKKYSTWKYKKIYSLLLLTISTLAFPIIMIIIVSIQDDLYRGLLAIEILIMNIIAVAVNGIMLFVNLNKLKITHTKFGN